ncbi:hypothetical protein JYP52_17635 [Nitratireductor aquibiodomus]|uniref:hypothetical protein n=1 Tax=Nitratireductor aquibiodomus TaxID=204799 RepID=UPI0019D40E63|nr:hypothetical protein [Nitratireductor aquibiodomus]MBN7762965.1 hypothetical protein [Nitratireductor aquibiodomus]
MQDPSSWLSSRDQIAPDWRDRIFVFWLGPAELSETRLEGLRTLTTSECRIHLVTEQTLASFVLPGRPFHAAFAFLSPIHQSDYLRAYFMHHFGGGYTDIKRCHASWKPAFEAIEREEALGAGYGEVPGGTARFHKSKIAGQRYFLDRPAGALEMAWRYRRTKRLRGHVIGNGAFIFRPDTELTGRWLSIVEKRLDILLPHLKANPARYPKEVPGVDYGDGPSRYPVPWSFLLGDVLAPLTLEYHRRILQLVPAPDFENYE